MSKLNYYNKLDDKKKLFSHDDFFRIDSKDKINSFVDYLEKRNLQQKENLSIIYRGVNEAKYKIYSSGQRTWLTKEIFRLDSYQQMTKKLVEHTLRLRNNLFDAFYDELGVLNKEMATMSFLQHYGSPTPLTDWTHSYDVGLFFTNYKYRFGESDKDDISNYMSLYEISLEEQDRELVNIGMLAKFAADDANFYSKRKRYSPTRIIRSLDLKSFFKYKVFYISDFYGKGNLPRTYINSNLNIISQKGLFIFNSSEDKPLEELFLGYPKTEGEFTSRGKYLHKIKCYNIHKNLSEYLTEYLNKKVVSKKTMFPQEEEVASESFSEYLGS